jgi:hypothetical protein
MRFAEALMPAFADAIAIPHDDCAHERIRLDMTPAALG